jgi:hypothetical protein
MSMNGFIKKTALGLCLGTGAALSTGCVAEYRTVTDPCWPERYSYQARQSVRQAFNTQAANGHILDQTVWNQHFEVGSDKLTEAGKDHLKYLARRLPAPDPVVYVQPAYYIEGTVLDAKALQNLNERRVAVVTSYLNNMMVLRGMTVTFDVAIRDAAEPGLPSRPASNLFVRPNPASLKTEFEERQVDLRAADATTIDQSISSTGVQESPAAPPKR